MVEVQDLFELIDEAFGRRRLLQQSPISPEVWELYLEDEDHDPEGRCDLLLTAASGADPAKIANALRNGIFAIEYRGTRTRSVEELRAGANIAANGESVVARLTLSELVCAAVPLTWWWQRLPAWLKAGSSDWAALAIESAEGVEFLTFAATAGLVQLITSGRGDKFIARFEQRRSQSARRRTVERSARTPNRMITEDILEMLEAFGELWDKGDFNRDGSPITAIDHIYPNRRSQLAVAEGRRAIKADASENLFRASTAKIVWAIVDSGVDARHPCFAAPSAPTAPDTFSSRVYETYDFSRIRPLLARPEEWISDAEVAEQLADRMRRGLGVDWSLLKEQLRVPHDDRYVVPRQEHGTHVAGILGANAPATDEQPEVMGVCPDIRMLDIRIFDPKGETDEFTILSALQFLVWLNGPANAPLVNGANLSFSLVHKVRSFACGSTPVCRACENLVKANIVTVAAAGNAGYTGDSRRPTLDDRYATVSITDPGNAEAVITVGSTHKISPVTYGVSYFSSRGPTGDGRRKPDLVAPGEKIVSALPDNRFGEMDGTSMAAPHVSGAAAILMARYPELRTQPTVVKDILCRSAFDLGREKSFQGAGLVDVLHALQFHWRSNGC